VAGNARRNALIDIPGWETRWVHLGPGPASHSILRLTFGSGAAVVLQTASAGIVRGSTATGSVALLTSLHVMVPPRSQAQPIAGDISLMLGSGASLDLYLPDGGDIMVISVPANRAITGARCVRLDPMLATSLARCADSLQQMRGAGAIQRRGSDAQRKLRDLLRSTADSLFRDAGSQLHAEPARLLRHFAVMRACDYIEAHLRTPISLAELCAAAGVSARALEYGFRDYYELGPMAYVRNLRLCRVRDDLLDSTRHGASVSNTARRWCFTHMGQFSHDYRELFGEMPSMTLTRPGQGRERHGDGVPRG
jgi:AraC-like DNA-binding protein